MDLNVLRTILNILEIPIPKSGEWPREDLRYAQGMVYLFQNKLYGADVLYSCGMYLHGPFSTDLSKDLYALLEQKDAIYMGLSTDAGNAANETKWFVDSFCEHHKSMPRKEATDYLFKVLYFAKRYSESKRVDEALKEFGIKKRITKRTIDDLYHNKFIKNKEKEL